MQRAHDAQADHQTVSAQDFVLSATCLHGSAFELTLQRKHRLLAVARLGRCHWKAEPLFDPYEG